MSRELRKFMRERGFFESESMSQRRKDVVKTITKVNRSHRALLRRHRQKNEIRLQVCEDWIREILLAEPMHAAKDPCEQFQFCVCVLPSPLCIFVTFCACMAPTASTRICPTPTSTPLSCKSLRACIFFHLLPFNFGSCSASRFIERDAHFPELFKRFEAMQREHPARIESLKFITSAKVNIISRMHAHLRRPTNLSHHFRAFFDVFAGAHHISLPRRHRH